MDKIFKDDRKIWGNSGGFNTGLKQKKDEISMVDFEATQNIHDTRRMNQNGSFRGFPKTEKEKKKSKYPLFSYIQEQHDLMQSMYSSGTSLSGIKAMDFTESEFRMLPITVGAKIAGKGILFVLLYFLLNLLDYIILSLFNLGGFSFYGLLFSSVIFASYFFFHKYTILSMLQFVIINEETPKTSRFYISLERYWSIVEYLFFALTFLMAFVVLFSKMIYSYVFGAVSNLNNALNLKINPDVIFHAAFLLLIASGIIAVIYIFISVVAKSKFEVLQKQNSIDIYNQVNPDKAVDILSQ
ncbi:hypothetical protein CQA57_07090 [Helicobacter anseris]|uniref:Uncharacterized protein n=1 Tax=Helicobacter anseris TaxID=375926 RepID=A0A3D8J6C3_9HELI|nr:hypothetical protein [Helicobacter anseris]RDU72361.1 hypothetical protein CQA57_07090 [Helicobacter anseris]